MSLEDAYQRIYVRAYEVSMVTEAGTGIVSMVKTIKDPDLDVLYQALQRSARALEVAREIFTEYGRAARAELETLLTLVERQQVEAKAERNEVLAQMMRGVLLGRHNGIAGRRVWHSIPSAPQQQELRLLGKRDDGTIYIQTGRWENTQWSVEAIPGFRAPTHWALMEELPQEYRT